MMESRLQRLRQKIAEREQDALLVTQPENRRYLSGFTGHDSPTSSAGWMVVGHHQAHLLTSFNYYGAAVQEAAGCQVVRAPGRLEEAGPKLLRDLGYRRIGFEGGHITYEQHRELAAVFQDDHLIPTRGVVEDLRQTKDATELACLMRAVEIADTAFAQVADLLRPGMTERQVAWELERAMRELGAEDVAFRPAVASGPQSAIPHAVASDRPLGEGEPIFVDIGAKVEGYCSDLTRTFCLGHTGHRFEALWALVLQAQTAAEEMLRPGVTGQQADTIAREHIAEAGYGEAFGHGLGHGVGLAVHEGPVLNKISTTTLEAGMAVTVEPGVYLPDWGGIRLEDIVVITLDGARVLTQAKKNQLAGQCIGPPSMGR